MQSIMNTVLRLLKWPIGLAILMITAPAFQADLTFLKTYVTSFSLVWFFLPMVITALFWFIVPGLSGSFLAIFEHEATHMLFALLTGHKPHAIDIQQDVGGSFSFYGEGNWLIALSPYFFPTFSALVMGASLFYLYLQTPLPNVYWAVLGVLTGYHIVAGLMQIHPKQTDFKSAGYLFSLIFLPGANLLTLGILFAFGTAGWNGIRIFINLLMTQITLFLTI